ncbi:MAG: hypothetical protein V1722_00360 [Candidatus Micrarchaeota archaeon]
MYRRGQASGPIELVVAVIILVASMSLAFIVMQSTSDAQCIDKLKSQMRDLNSVMIDVSLGSPSTSREANVELASCGGQSIEGVRIVYFENALYCGACGATEKGCWMIQPITYDKTANIYGISLHASTCINMPGGIVLEQDLNCDDDILTPGEVSATACPSNIGARSTNDQNCGLPPDIATSSTTKLLTMSKEPGETQYKVRITKGFSTAANEPMLNVCFLKKGRSS